MSPGLPGNLRAAIRRDVRPVRPLEPVSAAAARTAIGAGAALVVVQILFELRSDHEVLGTGGLWGLSFLEIAAALVLLGVAFRDAVPGRRLPAAVLPFAAAAGVGVHLAVAAWSRLQSRVPVPEADATGAGLLCGGLVVVLAVGTAGGAILLLRRGLSPRPGTTALGAGVAAGLVADGVWRTICPYTDPSHLLGSHTAGAAVGGAVLVLLGRRWLAGGRWSGVRDPGGHRSSSGDASESDQGSRGFS